jgi:uncharacterized CHY-type Zn-finger protein
VQQEQASLTSAVKPEVLGVDLDASSRCLHYHGPTDIIAIKMKCCQRYYACIACHNTLADHAPKTWPVDEWDRRAALCGACGQEMSVRDYMDSGNRCPRCAAAFNPGCRNHYHLYFEMASDSR